VPQSTVAAGGKPPAPRFASGFRDLSSKFLREENPRNYVAEALFFAVIVVVSAWPVASMLRAMGQLFP